MQFQPVDPLASEAFPSAIAEEELTLCYFPRSGGSCSVCVTEVQLTGKSSLHRALSWYTVLVVLAPPDAKPILPPLHLFPRRVYSTLGPTQEIKGKAGRLSP